jgi:diguanylate cyclase (GGDEF)-like protein/PAS domain S-box-containing protein
MTKHKGPPHGPAGSLESDKERTFAVSLMQHLVVPTFVIDPHCKVLIWNRACERLTGMAAADVIGTSEHWRGFYAAPRPCLADLIAQNRTDEVTAFYMPHEETGEVHYGLYAENWCVMPQVGTRLYLAIDAGPIYDSDGTLIAVVETLRDMTIQKEAQHELERLATQDGLTGIANRRRFDETLETEWRRSMRDANSVALLMVDVDHFKNYNDTFGHQAGDECLKQVAAAMAAISLRVSDLVARYGGEEFAVILPNVSLEGATVVAERIRTAVEQLQLPAPGGEGKCVTISIGAASATALAGGTTPAELISAADTALYQAKHQGRNRVVGIALGPTKKAS